jgi:haloalkane dehalogenase
MGSGRQLLYRRNRASPLIDLIDAIGNESALRVGGEGFRSESGEGMILEKNVFVERVLPGSVIRRLSEEEMAAYRRPFANPGEDRRPTLTWPRMFPIEGKPADVMKVVENYAAWLADTDVPKLFINADPGSILVGRQRELCCAWPNQTEVTVKGRHFVQEDSPDEIGQAVGRLRAPCTFSMTDSKAIARKTHAARRAMRACRSP